MMKLLSRDVTFALQFIVLCGHAIRISALTSADPHSDASLFLHRENTSPNNPRTHDRSLGQVSARGIHYGRCFRISQRALLDIGLQRPRRLHPRPRPPGCQRTSRPIAFDKSIIKPCLRLDDSGVQRRMELAAVSVTSLATGKCDTTQIHPALSPVIICNVLILIRPSDLIFFNDSPYNQFRGERSTPEQSHHRLGAECLMCMK